MAVLDFPAAPTMGQVATLTNGFSYQWDGTVWTLAAATGQAAGGDLSGSYPNPVVAKSSALPFAVPGGNTGAIRWGAGTSKGRLLHYPTAPASYWSENIALNAAADGWIADDSAKPSWVAALDSSGDKFVVYRAPTGATPNPVELATVDGMGRLSVPGPTANPATGVGGQSQIVAGTRAGKMRVMSLAGVEWDGICANGYYDGSNWYNDVAGNATWSMVLRTAPADYSAVFELRAPNAGAATFSTPFRIEGSTGKTYCTLGDGTVTNPMLGGGSVTRAKIGVGHAVNGYAVVMCSNPSIGQGVWVQVAACTITTRGGYVSICCNMGVGTFQSAATYRQYIGIQRNGGWIWWGGSPSTTPQQSALPNFSGWDNPPAGTWTYTVHLHTTGAALLMPADYGGNLWCIEMS
jgi:hypothetical protein